jgi:hypothetical protein
VTSTKAQPMPPSGTNADQPLIAMRHPVEKVKKALFAMSRCSDFVLGQGTPAATSLPTQTYLPYQYCPDEDAYYLVQTPRSACDEAFLYLAQYRSATHIVRVPRQRLPDFRPDLDTSDRCRSVLIFSIGRCGSTFLSKILSRIGYFSFSENDVYTGLSDIECDEVRRQVILQTTWMLNRYSGAPSGDVAIKMRAQCNVSFRDIHAALPDAKYVFVTRDLLPWARSYLGKFDISNENLAEILTYFVDSVIMMKERGLSFALLKYEDFQKDPAALLSVFAREATDKEVFLRQVADVLSRDAQEGERIRHQLSSAQLVEKCDAFLKYWHAVRPAADLGQLGLEM